MEERVLNYINDTITHKKYFMESAMRMSKVLLEENKEELAIELLKRAAYHDNSKFDKDEMCSLSAISCKKALIDPNINMDQHTQQILEHHWRKNRHHPEHFKDVRDMKEIDILEMVCDWHARSTQYGTDLLEFVEVRQENRFHFPDDMFKKIWNYCNIIIG